MVKRRVILVVRDGWGYTEEKNGNAVFMATTPNDDYYMKYYPWTLLKCTGNAVGLPEGTQGGSEPGHLTMGAGRVVWQPLEEINRSIKDGSFFEKKPLIEAINHCKETGGKLHLAGLFSDQGIHGTTNHLYALLELAKRNDFKRVYIHPFLDGRDVPERSASIFFDEVFKVMREKKVGEFASMVGRYYAMDRDNNWHRTEKAYNLLTRGEGKREKTPNLALKNFYNENPEISDYYFWPTVLVDQHDDLISKIEDGDSFILWNFRSDRARQITYALTEQIFTKFERIENPKVFYVCMSVYDQELSLPVVFHQYKVVNNLGSVLSAAGLRQLRIAETEKYAHVTFFFNSQIEKPDLGEDRILVPSPKVPNYEEKPEMSAYEITEKLIPKIISKIYAFILVNYANGDLVGHSANLAAGVKACEVVDQCLGRVVTTSLENNYTVLVTGDHGNIETMFYPNGEPNPSHGTNPVPFILITNEDELLTKRLKKGLGLSSVAPTILKLIGLKRPDEMNAPSIF